MTRVSALAWRHVGCLALSLYFSSCAYSKTQSTKNRVRWVHGAVASFVRDSARLPDAIDEICPDGGAICSGWQSSIPPVDAWGTGIEYRKIAQSYIVRSAGADKRFDTVDDIQLDPLPEIAWARILAGCYEFSRSIKRLGVPTPDLWLSDDITETGNFRVVAPRALDGSPEFYAEWLPTKPDQLTIKWFSLSANLRLKFVVSGDSVRTRFHDEAVSARRTTCPIR